MSGTGHVEAKSRRALARAVGRAESSVRKWIARDDWPFSREGPWDVARVKAWMEIQLKPDPAAAYRKRAKAAEAGTGEFASMSALTKARVQATIERALLIRQRRLTEAGKLHDVETCERQRLRRIYAVKGALEALPRGVSNSLVGQDRKTIEQILSDRVRDICEEFARADDGEEEDEDDATATGKQA